MKLYFSAFAFILCLCSHGQINVGPLEVPHKDPGEFKAADLASLAVQKRCSYIGMLINITYPN